MRRIQNIAMFILSIGLVGLITPSYGALQQGKEYALVSPPQPVETGKNIEVLEIFSYTCPHCFELEPILSPWLKRLPKDVTFRRMPAIFRDNWMPLAKAYYAMEVLGVTEKLHAGLFSAIHAQGLDLADPAKLLDWVAKQGVDRKKFNDVFASFSVQSSVQRAKQLTQAYGVTGVPSLVIDGKFLTSPMLTGGHAGLLPVLDQLIEQARRARPAIAKPAGVSRALPVHPHTHLKAATK